VILVPTDPHSTSAYTPPPIPVLTEQFTGTAGSVFLPSETHRQMAAATRPTLRVVPLIEDAFQSTASIFGAKTADPVSEYVAKEAVRLWKQQLTRGQIETRIRELRIEALRNNEKFSEKSLLDLRAFLRELPLLERPAIFLLDSGNLRVVWRNVIKEQLALQFLGNDIAQFVIFVLRQHPQLMSRTAGIDTLAALRSRLGEQDYRHLLFG
jgi:hypothetical protein